jgi:hypothetical protein
MPEKVDNELIYEVLKRVQADLAEVKAAQADRSRQFIRVRRTSTACAGTFTASTATICAARGCRKNLMCAWNGSRPPKSDRPGTLRRWLLLQHRGRYVFLSAPASRHRARRMNSHVQNECVLKPVSAFKGGFDGSVVSSVHG